MNERVKHATSVQEEFSERKKQNPNQKQDLYKGRDN